MNPVNQDRASVHESIEARAAAWLAQRDDNGLSAHDAREFAAWRAQDPRHEAAVKRLEATWSALQQLRDFRPEAQAHPDRDLLAPPRRRHAAPVRLRPALAAGAVFAAIAFTIFLYHHRPEPAIAAPPPATEHYATKSEGYQRATLTDGTIVELNENSEMTARFTDHERRIELARGEIHFTVTKDAGRPFVVVAGGVAVRAVGTAFNVRMTTGRLEVLVTEGRISLRQPRAKSSDAPLVSAGERATVPLGAFDSAVQVERLSENAISNALAWQGSRLVFLETPLSEVVAQFNRRNKVQVKVADAELGRLLVDGSFQSENVEALVRLLSNNEEIRVERPAPDLIILRREP